MVATLGDLQSMYERGNTGEFSHMIIKMDVMDYSDYPVYVAKGENPREVSQNEGGRTMECYSYALGWEIQSKEIRANHWEM